MSLAIFAGLVLIAVAELLVCSALCRVVEDKYYNPLPQQQSDEDGGHPRVTTKRKRNYEPE
jgi:hypothetical protein